MWPWYRYYHPWVWGWHRRCWIPPFACAWAPIPKEAEIAMLEVQERMLESEQESIRKRIEELKKQEVKNA